MLGCRECNYVTDFSNLSSPQLYLNCTTLALPSRLVSYNQTPKETTTKCSHLNKLCLMQPSDLKCSEVCFRKALVYFERPNKVNSKHLSYPFYRLVFHKVSFVNCVK